MSEKNEIIRRYTLITIIYSSLFYSFAQDSIPKEKKDVHSIYVVSTAIPGNLWIDLDNFWLEFGYSIRKNKSVYAFGTGFIVHSESSSEKGLWREVDQLHSRGYFLSVEYKYLLTKSFFVGAEIYWQNTTTVREQDGHYFQNSTVKSQYLVARSELGLVPTFGFVFANKRKAFCEVSTGFGVRHVWSRSSGKQVATENLEKEVFMNKIFDEGAKTAQRFTFQIKLGYSF